MIEGALPRKARQKYSLRGRAETHHPRPQRAANGLRSLTVIHTKYLLIRLFWNVSAIGTTRATGGAPERMESDPRARRRSRLMH